MALGHNRPFAHPISSFVTPVTAPSSDPDEGVLVQAVFNVEWLPYVLGALYQLTLQTTWKGTPDEVLEAQYRAIALMSLFGRGEAATVGAPFWDNDEDVDDEAPIDDQDWYGVVTNPDAPAGELDFVENAILWAFTGLVAVATFEVGGVAPAIAFHTFVEKFIIIQKRGNVAETIRFVVDNQDSKFISTAPYAEGDLIETTIVTPQTGGEHTIMIIGTTE